MFCDCTSNCISTSPFDVLGVMKLASEIGWAPFAPLAVVRLSNGEAAAPEMSYTSALSPLRLVNDPIVSVALIAGVAVQLGAYQT